MAVLSLTGERALAGEEAACEAQYTLEERLILEWAAFGGDPHAQFAVSQCAFPRDGKPLSQNEKIYALKWTTLAMCDGEETPFGVRRDRLTRKLKDKGDLSFRRFGGVAEDEKWSKRDKRFREYRTKKRIELEARFAALLAETSEAEKAAAREALIEDHARLGALGLVRVAELSDCASFGASPAFKAASWAAAEDVWIASGANQIYGDLKHANVNRKESAALFAALPPTQQRVARLVRGRLLKTDPRRLAELEDEAALGRLEEMRPLGLEAGVEAGPRAVTTAVQYALEALGWIEFQEGPDNDYGPSTIEAVKRAQAHYGVDETRWMSPRETRRLICDAAVKKGDPVSLYHLALMYAEGWGFPEDDARARVAIDRARAVMDERLAAADALPEWKRAAYPSYRERIANAAEIIEGQWMLAPAHARASEAGALCR
ncbi:MAG: peptidoglycan-binding protein [Amphiplicatus sp.]